ncbi:MULTISPECIES: ABC transporter ATP-binding protein [unclassified Granulicatella]|uniref:ABC transporter ATP-binding protein n=1 Tax=unclassified Granulicatella TaxID=2630493 RepID=UPI001CB13B1D|nr:MULTISPECIES: ABC transporter ATP-binding protein [unclassified Granulicatella]MBF1732413.1 ABC transporter ATP-binding protein [Streptococcus sp.]MDK8381098.1 ABC transporter ATP-binding protein [Granulicatella sp. UMB5615B]MDK8522125.1 ABC transporter ATP-binding protein [Granulicatella sp. UMB5615A]
MITVEKITKRFGNKTALNQIQFNVEKGEIFGFLGPSGAGKTTLINILTGQLKADEGTTQLLGKDTKDLTPEDLAHIGLVGDSSGYYEKLSLEKNLIVYAKIYGLPNSRVDEVLEQVGLLESKKTIAEKLSTGMRQRMFLARALLNRPGLLFLDEPTSGLDPMTSKKIHRLLEELKAAGTTIFLTTHDMVEATELCDRISLLNQGDLVEIGTPRDIIQKYNKEKRVKVIFRDHSEQVMAFEDLKDQDMRQVELIHSMEPTLEDIFIQLTGEKLND